jgi:homoserine kinase
LSFRLRLPATSANLGASFDTAAVALGFHLEIEADESDRFTITASGRDADICASTEKNLILETYRSTLAYAGVAAPPVAITMHNQIPLGMGCGSSAASRLAAVAMAVYFGKLDWPPERILAATCVLEGHPDNAASCWLGGLVLSSCEGDRVHTIRTDAPADWRAMLVMPREPLPTRLAREVLPSTYSRTDTVANVQAAALLGLAFAQARGDLLRVAMADRLHQPYRARMCPLLPPLLPLAGRDGILGVALSGAGPSVLLVLENQDAFPAAANAVEAAVGSAGEIFLTEFELHGASDSYQI